MSDSPGTEIAIWQPPPSPKRQGTLSAPALADRVFMPTPNDPLIKAMEQARARKQPYRVNPNLYGFGAYQGVKDVPGALINTMQILRAVPQKNPVIASIIAKRQNQIGNWSRRPRFEGDTGFQVGMRESKKKPSAAARQRMHEIEEVILLGGVRTDHPRTGQRAVWDAEGSAKAMGMQKATRALVRDSLTLDAAAIRIQPGVNSKKWPISFWDPVDAALVRFATPADQGKDAQQGYNSAAFLTPYKPEIRTDIDAAFVMVNANGVGVQAEYAWDEMGYLIRNPRTDEWVMGYGCSEIEQLIAVISGILYGIYYNTEFFDSNHIPPGILAMPGEYSDEALTDMRQQMRMMCGGPGQFWTLPILGKGMNQGSMEYIPLRQGDNDMHWREFILFCSNIAAALYNMDSSEINMTNFGASSNALANPAPENKIAYSQETGLEPVLSSIAAFYDEQVVMKYDEDFVFEYMGLSQPDENLDMAKTEARFSMGSTPNMERTIKDERPILDALDRELWYECMQEARKKADDVGDPDEAEEIAEEMYRKQGGQFAMWPDAPVGNPGALQIWQIEHNIQQQQPLGMEDDQMGGGGGESGGGPDDGSAEFPAVGPDGKPLPQAADKEGPDTHVADMGSALIRKYGGGGRANSPFDHQNPNTPVTKPQGNLRKSVIEVVIRRPQEEE